MQIIDLTGSYRKDSYKLQTNIVPLHLPDGTPYSGLCTSVNMDSMMGSYIDFPGHFDKTDNGQHPGNVRVSDYYRQPAAVVRPVPDHKGEVSLEALQRSAEVLPDGVKVLVINALAGKEIDEIPNRSVYLSLAAAEWIWKKGFRTVVSDIWENVNFEGVFFELFKHGVSCVCMPQKLVLLPANKPFHISIIFFAFEGAVQTPCRIIAEIE